MIDWGNKAEGTVYFLYDAAKVEKRKSLNLAKKNTPKSSYDPVHDKPLAKKQSCSMLGMLQLRPDTLESKLDILQDLTRRLPVIELAKQFHSFFV
jgi:hypothetical protein